MDKAKERLSLVNGSGLKCACLPQRLPMAKQHLIQLLVSSRSSDAHVGNTQLGLTVVWRLRSCLDIFISSFDRLIIQLLGAPGQPTILLFPVGQRRKGRTAGGFFLIHLVPSFAGVPLLSYAKIRVWVLKDQSPDCQKSDIASDAFSWDA